MADKHPRLMGRRSARPFAATAWSCSRTEAPFLGPPLRRRGTLRESGGTPHGTANRKSSRTSPSSTRYPLAVRSGGWVTDREPGNLASPATNGCTSLAVIQSSVTVEVERDSANKPNADARRRPDGRGTQSARPVSKPRVPRRRHRFSSHRSIGDRVSPGLVVPMKRHTSGTTLRRPDPGPLGRSVASPVHRSRRSAAGGRVRCRRRRHVTFDTASTDRPSRGRLRQITFRERRDLPAGSLRRTHRGRTPRGCEVAQGHRARSSRSQARSRQVDKPREVVARAPKAGPETGISFPLTAQCSAGVRRGSGQGSHGELRHRDPPVIASYKAGQIAQVRYQMQEIEDQVGFQGIVYDVPTSRTAAQSEEPAALKGSVQFIDRAWAPCTAPVRAGLPLRRRSIFRRFPGRALPKEAELFDRVRWARKITATRSGSSTTGSVLLSTLSGQGCPAPPGKRVTIASTNGQTPASLPRCCDCPIPAMSPGR